MQIPDPILPELGRFFPSTNVTLPNGWIPRPHQLGLWTHFQNNPHLPGKRAVEVWHRRSGKDSTALNITAKAMQRRVGTYWHMLPEAEQARKAVWTAIDARGRRIIDQAFPVALRRRTLDHEMMIEWWNGSIWQLVGSDNYNSLVGTNPIGVVMSEYSIAKPAAWDYIRPILRENGGWAIFIYTPRGKNHGYRLYRLAVKLAQENPELWHAGLLSCDDTGSRHLRDEEEREGMAVEMLEQEYDCSWTAATPGAYYSRQIAQAYKEGRICKVPHAAGVPVNTFWDLGNSDTTAVWLHQQVGMQHRWLRCMEDHHKPPEHYAAWLQQMSMQHGYVYGRHFMPHDAEIVTLNTVGRKDGRNTAEMFENLGLRNIEIVDRIDDVTVGINLVRQGLAACWFDAEGCEDGIEALTQYTKKFDEKQKTWLDKPLHDWSSNYADAFRQWAQGWNGNVSTEFKRRHRRRSHRTA